MLPPWPQLPILLRMSASPQYVLVQTPPFSHSPLYSTSVPHTLSPILMSWKPPVPSSLSRPVIRQSSTSSPAPVLPSPRHLTSPCHPVRFSPSQGLGRTQLSMSVFPVGSSAMLVQDSTPNAAHAHRANNTIHAQHHDCVCNRQAPLRCVSAPHATLVPG